MHRCIGCGQFRQPLATTAAGRAQGSVRIGHENLRNTPLTGRQQGKQGTRLGALAAGLRAVLHIAIVSKAVCSVMHNFLNSGASI